ncbi:DNA repair protein RadA [Candidatus Parcubacteria bacterium]|nr:MAG: DNA repair protein RadA [Candidatus Parcubacteria bacterium]
MSSRISKVYECSHCGAQSPKWSGRCFECGSWGTLAESVADTRKTQKRERQKVEPASIVDFKSISVLAQERLRVGIGEIDRVFGGGIVVGSISLLAGEPGIGKSTLLAQIALQIGKDRPVLYVSGEESAQQVKGRFGRLAIDFGKIKFAAETNTEKIIAAARQLKPALLVVDSIQTMYTAASESEPGSVNQIKACALEFLELAKEENITTILVGHITKDGSIAGPKSLEHIVDAVVYLETDNTNYYRLLRSSKNRFGSTQELGVFEMTNLGFKEVKNVSAAFLDKAERRIPGSAISAVTEGTRTFLVEIQALVSKTVFGYPQRKSSGFDLNRLQILTAVLVKQAQIRLADKDIIVNVVGGLKIDDTSSDLAVCAAIISSLLNQPVRSHTLILGEVGLGGEVRRMHKLADRLKEAKKLGFVQAVIPAAEEKISGIKILSLDSLKDLPKLIF